MPLFRVTIGYQGTKTFEIEANNYDEAHAHAERRLGYLEHYSNPVSDDLNDYLVSVEPHLTKAEAYQKLATEIMDMTENQGPLELLKLLKPE